MKDLIKEVALEVALKVGQQYPPRLKGEDAVIEFATAFLAELSKRAEAVAYITYKGNLLHAADPRVIEYSNPDPLFTFPPINDIEAIENRVAEACAATCDEQKDECGTDTDYWHGAKWCAEAIRNQEWRKYK